MLSKAVLITGCSSGIGHATAELLLSKGWNVYATARRPESIADLSSRGAKTLALDVTDEASMTAAVDAVKAAEGAVGVLINNAGYSQSGAVESVPLDQVRRQFETNVFGLIRMCQLVLPGMREQRWGKDRQHRLDGRPADVPRRRRLPRDQVRGRGDQRRASVRGAGVRRRCDPGRARADHHELRRGRDRDCARRGRRAVRLLQREGREADDQRLQGSDVEARWPAGDGRQADRRRARGQAAEGTLPDHRKRPLDDQPAADHARPRVGPDRCARSSRPPRLSLSTPFHGPDDVRLRVPQLSRRSPARSRLATLPRPRRPRSRH